MASLKQIAEISGVSVWTASKVLAGKAEESRIGKDCADRVQKVAHRLGYVRNYHAESLRHGRSKTIGAAESYPAATDTEHASFWSPLFSSIEATIRQCEYDMLIVGESREGNAQERGIGYLKSARIDALVVPCVGHIDYEALARRDSGPVVLALPNRTMYWPSIALDVAAGMRAAAEHLAQLGHRHLLWYGPTRTPRADAEKRIAALSAAAAERQLRMDVVECPLEAILTFAGSSRTARAQFREVMATHPAATAVVCFNDALAIGVCQAVQDAGRRIPEDLSVIGFDNIYSNLFSPDLTTISHMLPQIGACAARLAIEMAEDRSLQQDLVGSVEQVAAVLVVRETTARPPA